MNRSTEIGAILMVAAGAFAAGRLSAPVRSSSEEPSTVVRVDTVEVVVERAPRETVRRIRDTLVVYLPRADTVAVRGPDSVAVSLPVESREYAGDNYRAYISGYRARLDSIFVDTRHVSTTVSAPGRSCGQTSRWSIAFQAGVGITPAGIQPYAGVGVSYRITR